MGELTTFLATLLGPYVYIQIYLYIYIYTYIYIEMVRPWIESGHQVQVTLDRACPAHCVPDALVASILALLLQLGSLGNRALPKVQRTHLDIDIDVDIDVAVAVASDVSIDVDVDMDVDADTDVEVDVAIVYM